MRRHRDVLLAHGATRHDASWSIPVTALIAAGLMPNVTPPDASGDVPVTPVMTGHGDGSMTRHDDAEVVELRHQLALERARREAAEQVAAERQHIIDVQAQALRLLEPGPSATLPPAIGRRPFWSRRRGPA
jgi:hypothetical protein